MLIVLSACGLNSKTTLSGLSKKKFQVDTVGQLTNLFVLTNKNGMEVCITNYGARIVSVMAPDQNGKMEDVVCGFDNISDYMTHKQTFGAIVGRYIGRILNARFTIDSVEYKLKANKGPHCAHGGDPGFADKIWQPQQIDHNAIQMSYLSIAGENGFPGNLGVHVTYMLTDDNKLDIRYEAKTDAPTVVNLSNHSFFNISGDFNSSVERQILYVNADRFTPYDTLKCITGEMIPVKDTPMDFTTLRRIGEYINDDYEQLHITDGYDHTWVLNTKGDDTKLAVKVVDPKSGRGLEVYTSEPAIQVFTANGFKGELKGKKGIAYLRRSAICLEAMHFADSPNKPQFPSTVLRPGKVYHSHCVYKFSVTHSPIVVSTRSY